MNNNDCSIEKILKIIEIGANFDREQLTDPKYFSKDPRNRVISRYMDSKTVSLATGLCTLIVNNVVPISSKTEGEGGVTLFEAVRKCVHCSPFDACYVKVGLGENALTFKYLECLFKVLNINYIAAAVVFGIDLREAENLYRLGLDKYTHVIFSYHYKINFSIRGAKHCNVFTHEVKVNSLIKELILTSSEKNRSQLKTKLLFSLFDSGDIVNGNLTVSSVPGADLEKMSRLISAFKISPSYGVWLLRFNGDEPKEYYENMLRRSQVVDKSKGHLIYWNGRRNITKLCKNLLRTSIKFQCTTEEFIIAFLTASEIAVRLCNVSEDSIVKTRGWLASQMYKCFRDQNAGEE